MKTIDRHDFGDAISIINRPGTGMIMIVSNPLTEEHNHTAFVGHTVYANGKKWYIYGIEHQGRVKPGCGLGLLIRDVTNQQVNKLYRLPRTNVILTRVEKGVTLQSRTFPALLDPNNPFCVYDDPDDSFAQHEGKPTAIESGFIELVVDTPATISEHHLYVLNELVNGAVILKPSVAASYQLSLVRGQISDETIKELFSMGLIEKTPELYDYQVTDHGRQQYRKTKRQKKSE